MIWLNARQGATDRIRTMTPGRELHWLPKSDTKYSPEF